MMLLQSVAGFLSGFRSVFAIAILIAVFFAGVEVEAYKNTAEKNKAELQRSKETIETMEQLAKDMNESAVKFQGKTANLGVKIDAITKNFSNAKPLPADCLLDDVRLRNITEAVDAVNSAAARRESSKALQTVKSASNN